ncbi:MAG: SAM-dependent methyltransferase [Ruminococcaceae bacterium]|nr:SAM-dependent methyltransferase [Oscillospiraceae bacterium]
MAEIINGDALLLLRLIQKSARMSVMRKTVLSKPLDRSVKKACLVPKSIAGKTCLQLESFGADNKAKHKNIDIDDAETLLSVIEGFGQINLLSTAGDCEYRVSKSGNCVLLGGHKLEKALFGEDDGIGVKTYARIEPGSNNKKKNYILSGDEPFLKLLGVADEKGRVFDKKQAKFRQINKFLEFVRDIEDKLPEGDLRICDLCCGKSYLSFAVYHYFAVIKQRRVTMTGVDLKSDVIEYCNEVSQKLGFNGLEFLCGDVNLYDTSDRVNMVISLHACDIATDIVINKAIEWDVDVILSTPCCHHDLNKKLNCEPLEFIGRHSMLRQKLCDAATDALRLSLLEANGYDVAAFELIDPEETPKNVMLRGIRKKNFDKSSDRARELMARYREAYRFLTGIE